MCCQGSSDWCKDFPNLKVGPLTDHFVGWMLFTDLSRLTGWPQQSCSKTQRIRLSDSTINQKVTYTQHSWWYHGTVKVKISRPWQSWLKLRRTWPLFPGCHRNGDFRTSGWIKSWETSQSRGVAASEIRKHQWFSWKVPIVLFIFVVSTCI